MKNLDKDTVKSFSDQWVRYDQSGMDNNEAKKINRVIDVLIQVHIAKEETKTGFSFHELEEVFSYKNQNKFENIRIRGLMGMATFTENQNEIRKEFSMLKKTFENKSNHIDGLK